MASTIPRGRQGPHSFDRAGQEAKLVGVKRYRDGAGLFVSNDVDDGSVAIEDRDDGHFTLSHFVDERWSFGWLTSRCQTTAAKPSVCGVTRSAATVGMRTQASDACFVKPPSRPTMPNTFAPTSRASSRDRTRLTLTFFSRLPPPTLKTSKPSPARRREPAKPLGEARVPPLVVHARRQLADVVGRRVGLEPAQLSEVVDRVARVAGAAADAEDEEAAPASAHGGEPVGHGLDAGGVELGDEREALVEVFLGE